MDGQVYGSASDETVLAGEWYLIGAHTAGKPYFPAIVLSSTIVLPRQARDRHDETENKARFSPAGQSRSLNPPYGAETVFV